MRKRGVVRDERRDKGCDEPARRRGWTQGADQRAWCQNVNQRFLIIKILTSKRQNPHPLQVPAKWLRTHASRGCSCWPRMGLGARAGFGRPGGAKAREKQRRAEMRAAEKKMQREQRAQAEAWFAWFDLNGDGVLQRTELAALLKHVSGIDPSDEALDMALADARAADIKAGRGRMVPQALTLHVPEAAAPGQVIQVGLPGGGTTAVTVPADAVPGQSFKFTFECMQLDGVSKNAAFAVVTKFSVRLAASSTSQPASR